MDTLARQIPGVLEHFGRAFLLAAFLPALLFLAAQDLFILPGAPASLIPPAELAVAPPAQPTQPSISAAPTAAPTSGSEAATAETTQGEVPAAAPSSTWAQLVRDAVTALVLPALLGILLLALNNTVIRFFEGSYGWQKRLLAPLLRRNQKRARTLYHDLVKTKEEYTRRLSLLNPAAGPPDLSTQQALASLARQMQEELDKIDIKAPIQLLPRRAAMVTPTALGNAFAVMEEYPYERYGMDAMIFWPRLRSLVEEAAGAQLTNYKIVLDMLLNIALLAGVFGIECWVLGAVHAAWLPVIAGAVAFLVAYAAYGGGVQTAWALKEVVAGCFDFSRHLLLEKFGLQAPGDLEGEQLVWLRLGQFLRRGESFYFPGWARSAASAPALSTPTSPPAAQL